jgi:hypothetical protein
MIPNIFISSTISDLHYLRDGLRDAIDELGYHPVMSEHGEVGYLNPNTAAESCYRSVRQCHIVVLIVGKRYGSMGEDGLSVTHREFLAAKQEQLPIITFVEPQVLNYKDVYDADTKAQIWESFAAMDNARKTFQLLDAISLSETYNAIIPIASVGDAKRKLKLQIADFVGDRLSEVSGALGQQLRDVLAEIKTIRNQLMHTSPSNEAKEQNTKRFLAVTRFLLNENATEYRKFLEQIFGDLDAAIDAIADCQNLNNVISRAGYTYELVGDDAVRQNSFFEENASLEPEKRAVFGTVTMHGGYVLYANKTAKISSSIFAKFDTLQKALHVKAKVA